MVGKKVPESYGVKVGPPVPSIGKTTSGKPVMGSRGVGTREDNESSTATGRSVGKSCTVEGAGLELGNELKLGASDSHWGSVQLIVSLLDVAFVNCATTTLAAPAPAATAPAATAAFTATTVVREAAAVAPAAAPAPAATDDPTCAAPWTAICANIGFLHDDRIMTGE